MPNFTPQEIVDELHTSDLELETLAKRFAWFKGQRDHWKDVFDFAKAEQAVLYEGPSTKAKEAGLARAAAIPVQIPWLPEGNIIPLQKMARLAEASFDLVSKEYTRMETHIMILQSVNKNVMQDYGRAGANEWAH